MPPQPPVGSGGQPLAYRPPASSRAKPRASSVWMARLVTAAAAVVTGCLRYLPVCRLARYRPGRVVLQRQASPGNVIGKALAAVVRFRLNRYRPGAVWRLPTLGIPQVLRTPLHRRPWLTSGRRRAGQSWLRVFFPPQILYPVPTVRYPNPFSASSTRQQAGGVDPWASSSTSTAADPIAATSKRRGNVQ